MSRQSVQQKQQSSAIGQMPQDVDVEAEHDPKLSRQASNAALRRQAADAKADPAPSQAYADQNVINAIQAHVKLTAARMHAGAAQIVDLLKSPTNGPAGSAPMLLQIEAHIALVNDDLDSLSSQISRVPNVLRGTLDVELGALHGAFHQSWAPALNKVYNFTHDQDGKMHDFAQGMNLSLTPSQNKVRGVFHAAGVDPSNIRAVLAPRITDPANAVEQRDEELLAAELEAVKAGMFSVEVALDLLKADLRSSVSDQSQQALALTVSVEQLVAVLGPISPDHIGKISKLPILIKQVEALQAEVMQMKEADDDKGKALAPKIGYNTQLSSNLYKLKTKINTLDAVQKANAKKR